MSHIIDVILSSFSSCNLNYFSVESNLFSIFCFSRFRSFFLTNSLFFPSPDCLMIVLRFKNPLLFSLDERQNVSSGILWSNMERERERDCCYVVGLLTDWKHLLICTDCETCSEGPLKFWKRKYISGWNNYKFETNII